MIITFGNQDTWTSENWSMTIDLEVLSGMEGKKIEVQKHPDSKEFVKVLAYPTPKVRKLFKLMLQTLDEASTWMRLKSIWRTTPSNGTTYSNKCERKEGD